MLNSRNAQLKEVRDFFHSAQMNINNPHFMIQQGKITKVINMKPKDLLGLIEEVSGTRMYEMKRANAVKLIQKKEKKVSQKTRKRSKRRWDTRQADKRGKHYKEKKQNEGDGERYREGRITCHRCTYMYLVVHIPIGTYANTYTFGTYA